MKQTVLVAHIEPIVLQQETFNNNWQRFVNYLPRLFQNTTCQSTYS